jgi:uncharacterized membrane protein YdcZ (DUF606 family)
VIWFLFIVVLMLAATVVDHFGLAGIERRELTLGRSLGIVLLLFGAALIFVWA